MLSTYISPFCVVWEITDTCNLNCLHCRTSRQKGHVNTNYEVEEVVLKEIVKNKVLVINISGGEPLLHPRCIEFIDYFSKNNLFVGLSTNGLLFANFISELKNKLGFIQFSLDGNEEFHNKFRGAKNSYKKAIEAAILSKENNIKTQFNTVITSANISHIDEIISIGSELKIEMHFRRFIPTGFGEKNNYLVPSLIDYKRVINKLLHYKFEKKLSILIEEPLIALWSEGQYLPQIGCGAGITQLGIDMNGNMYPCIFYREKIGNILEEDFIDIWKNSKLLNLLRSRDYGKCSNCKINKSCGACNACNPKELGTDIFCET